jgi:APA family basic amino acid/polyamine antiporter
MKGQLFATKSIEKLIAESQADDGPKMKKILGPWSLVALGIGAIIGSGIFTLTGTAAAGEDFKQASILHSTILDLIRNGMPGTGRPPAGPAIVWSFLFTAVVCGLCALCYAEMASMIPVAGSAYTYSYATLGEIIAWIIGWDLILEYAVSNVAVAVGFSGYLTSLLDGMGIHLPDKFSHPVWEQGEFTGNWFNLPAFLIVMFITVMLVRGTKEGALANNVIVMVKIAAILVFILAGIQFFQPVNWKPFSPSGYRGVLTGSAVVFFTYIGFDSVSTAAQDCKNPKKDLPFGIIVSLIVCTVLYIGVALVLTGMDSYVNLGNDAPVANALKKVGANIWVQRAIVIGALGGMVSSILVFQFGQARIWFSMSRDKLFPTFFGAIHPRFNTPHISTWLAGFAVAIPAGIWGIADAADLTNIGTLFAFILVSAAVVVLRRTDPGRARTFRVPFAPLLPILSIIACFVLMGSLTLITWIRFVLWLAIGQVVYFAYSRHRSEFAGQ